jgi:hypothetical protein
VHEIFLQLTSLTRTSKLRRLLQSPFNLHESVQAMIERESAHALAGRKARIIVKLNALVDPQTIETLYRASRSGVKIDLIVRGVCALRPGIPGRVREHPRALDRRPLPRALARLLVRERRRAGAVPVERRLDGAQLLPPGRDRLPGAARRARQRIFERPGPTCCRQHPMPGNCGPTAPTAAREPVRTAGASAGAAAGAATPAQAPAANATTAP